MSRVGNELFENTDITELIRRFITQAQTENLKTKDLYPADLGDYKLTVSFGMGVVSGIPWIAILGPDQKVSDGIYPVFLYYKASDHLILAYGISETNKPSKNWGFAVNDKQRIADRMSDHGFPAKRYGDSYVAAEYPNILQYMSSPAFSEQVITDLATVLNDYREVMSMQPVELSFNPTAIHDVPLVKYENTTPSAKINQILYGPPGTGKTYGSINLALEILDPAFLQENQNNRQALKHRFDELARAERVRFVTFHQSFSYEDFVEGLRAVTNDDNQIEYRVESGIFKRLCDDARTQGIETDIGVRTNPQIWKISIDGTGSSPTKSFCLDNSEARIGWGKTGDLRGSLEDNAYYQSLGLGDKGTLRYFSEEMAVGDILLCIHSADTINAIGVVTGEYEFEESTPSQITSDFQHVRSVKWLYRDLKLSILPLNENKRFTLKTVYQLDRFTWGDLYAYLQSNNYQPVASHTNLATKKPYVLIIDEINRGNVSRIFGELISLIEPSKREGATEALSAELPYSKKPFSIPDNVYLIGTMNTADRSLAGLDIALRRRFIFKEMHPSTALLDDINVEGLNIGELLRTLNERIEVLLDREHCLGHAYFIPLKSDPTLDQLKLVFRNQVLPLLQEYFFEDWQRIQWVLNDHRKPVQNCFLYQHILNIETLFGEGVDIGSQHLPWRINDEAFERIEAYQGIINHKTNESDGKIINEATHAGYVIKQLQSGTIEVWRNERCLQTAKPALRELANSLGVRLDNSEGNSRNTRQLGRDILAALQKSGPA